MNKKEMVSSWIRKAKQRSSSLFTTRVVVVLAILAMVVSSVALAIDRAKVSTDFTAYADCLTPTSTSAGATTAPSPTPTNSTTAPSPTSTDTTATPSPTSTAATATPSPTSPDTTTTPSPTSTDTTSYFLTATAATPAPAPNPKHATKKPSHTSSTSTDATPTPSPTDTATSSSTPPSSPSATATPGNEQPTPSATPCQNRITSYPTSDGQIAWTGDWEQDGQWSIDAGMPDWGNSSVERVQNPVRQGQYAAKFTVNSGKPGGSDDERAEVSSTQQNTGGYADQDWYYSWSIYVPSVPNQATGWSDWTDTTQWMDLRHNCSPPLQVEIVPGSSSNNNTPQFLLDHELNSQESPCDYSKPEDLHPLTSLKYDQWIDFTAHIKWSEDPQVGYVQMWVNGQNVLPLTHMQTLDQNSKGVYMEQALYRPDRSGTNVLYMDATRRHTAYDPTASYTPNTTSCVTPASTLDSAPTAVASSTPTSDNQGNGNTSHSKKHKKSSSKATATPDATSTAISATTSTIPLPCATSSPIPTTTAATATSTAPVTNTSKITNANFQGIYVFSGNNASTFSNNPTISGTYLGYYWSQLEPQQGQYDWSLIDNDMKPWADSGKSVILRVSASGQAKWQPPTSAHGTPQWVYDQGVSSVTETDGSVIPQYWNPIFLQDLNTFVQAFASRYDGNAHISAVEIGVGMGGETKPDTIKNGQAVMQQWQTIGYTNAVWWDTIQKIITMYISAFHKTPLAVMPDASFIGTDKGYSESMVLDFAVSHNLWLQDNGLVANRNLPAQWKKVPILAEQRQATDKSGDTLQQDLQAALQNNAVILLVFASDISKSENQSTLQQAATMSQK